MARAHRSMFVGVHGGAKQEACELRKSETKLVDAKGGRKRHGNMDGHVGSPVAMARRRKRCPIGPHLGEIDGVSVRTA